MQHQCPRLPPWSLRALSDRKSTRLNSSHLGISYAVFCLKKKTKVYNSMASAVYSTPYGCHLTVSPVASGNVCEDWCPRRTPVGSPRWRMRSFFFNDTATTEIYTLSLHDALPIWNLGQMTNQIPLQYITLGSLLGQTLRSEEHTSELQSLRHLVCRLLLEKKK